MGFLFGILIILVILVLLYFYCIAPQNNKEAIKKFLDVHFAHRGLHGNGIPENSMKAFSLAVENGYGIELDIHLTKDKKIVVIHDSNTKRVCGEELMVEEATYEELLSLSLQNTNEKIPLFEDVLKLVDGKVPLLVELKSRNSETVLCHYAASMLDHYQGDYCIESFNPMIVEWFKNNRKDVVRGQLSTKIKTVGGDNFKDKLFGFLITNLLTNFLARPNFIAYEYKYMSNLSITLCKKLFKAPVFVWTLRGSEQQKQAESKFSGYIFEK